MTLLRRLFPHHERRIPWKLVRSWCIQGIGWYALTEVAARTVLEASVVLAMAAAGVRGLSLVAGWLLAHTLLWFLLYGGFMRIWIVFGLSTRVPHLEAQLSRLRGRAGRQRLFRLVFLRGSASRRELNERSDIDVCVVPDPGVRAHALGVLALWGLRLEAVLRRYPVEARWLDAERYVPYHVIEETPLVLFRRQERPESWRERLANQGILLAFSGIDGSGKTTVAKRLIASLRAEGFHAEKFWGHRQAWVKPRSGPDLGLAVLFESLWRRIGRQVPEFERHPSVKIAHDLLNVVDYVYVRWRVSDSLRPNTILLCDRYVADVIAYLRTLGPLKVTIEGLLLGLSREPDIAILFHIDPKAALARKQENTLEELDRFTREYIALRDFLGLEVVDASGSVDDVYAQVARILKSRLDWDVTAPPDPHGPAARAAPSGTSSV